MNELATRKRLIIAQADLYRHVLELECQCVGQRMGQAQDFVHQKKWWLLGGAAVGGFLLAPRWRGILGLLPLIPDVLRLFRR